MAKAEGVHTTKAPAPLPQFSQAVKYNGMVYCSGNIGLSPETTKIVEGTVKDRAVRIAFEPSSSNTPFDFLRE